MLATFLIVGQLGKLSNCAIPAFIHPFFWAEAMIVQRIYRWRSLCSLFVITCSQLVFHSVRILIVSHAEFLCGCVEKSLDCAMTEN